MDPIQTIREVEKIDEMRAKIVSYFGHAFASLLDEYIEAKIRQAVS